MKKYFLSLFLLPIYVGSFAQNIGDLNIGISRTEAGTAAVNLAAGLFKNYESILNSDSLIWGDNWYLYFRPQADVLYGSSDAFNGFSLKMTGLGRFFETTILAPADTNTDGTISPAVIGPNLDKVSWAIPLSAGVETNKDFKNYNVVGEIGLLPWYKPLAYKAKGKVLKQLCNSINIGLFFQGGSKFGKQGISDTDTTNSGSVVEAKETPSKGIARIKASAIMHPTLLSSKTGGFSLNAHFEAHYWFDLINKAHYYQLQAGFLIKIMKNIGVELKYLKGSGAPNFNDGNQFTSNIILSF